MFLNCLHWEFGIENSVYGGFGYFNTNWPSYYNFFYTFFFFFFFWIAMELSVHLDVFTCYQQFKGSIVLLWHIKCKNRSYAPRYVIMFSQVRSSHLVWGNQEWQWLVHEVLCYCILWLICHEQESTIVHWPYSFRMGYLIKSVDMTRLKTVTLWFHWFFLLLACVAFCYIDTFFLFVGS